MMMMIGRMAIGTPLGANSLRKCKPCCHRPQRMTVKKTRSASDAVTTIWLVTENV